MRRIILQVTAAHIASGRPLSPIHGPITRAVRDRCKPGVLVQLTRNELFLCFQGRRWWLYLPPPAMTFIALFNRRLPCAPISFRMELPAELLQERAGRPRSTPL